MPPPPSFPPVPSPETSPAPARRIAVFKWTLLGALAFHLAQFAAGLVALAGAAGSMSSVFREIALRDYLWNLVRDNAEVLLKATLPLTLLFTVCLYPAVRMTLRKNTPPRRWSVFWRSTLLCAAVDAWFSFRLAFSKPWLTENPAGEHWYFTLRQALPEAWREPAFQALREIPPAVLPAAVLVFYIALLLRKLRPAWPGFARFAAACGLLAAGTGLATAVDARRHHRTPDPRTRPVLAASAATPFVADAATRDAPNAGRPRRPNILILASDSLRADRLSCNGYPRPVSPAIDALAAESVNFTKCFTPIASTVESTTTMMSSQYPHTHGLRHMFPDRDRVERARRELPALARTLAEHGYETAVVGDWCAGVYSHLRLGFEEIQAPHYPDFTTYLSQAVYLAHRSVPRYFDNAAGPRVFPKLESSALFTDSTRVTDRVVERLTARGDADEPFFWKVFYSCTHLPYSVKPEFARKFTDPAYDGPHRNQVRFNLDEWVGTTGSAEKWREMSAEDVRRINDLYDAAVNEFDSAVERVLAALRATGQLENTIILLTSDHGDDLFEPWCTLGHGVSFNGGDQNSNVPCLLRVPGPGKPAARKVDRIVRTLDFAPTLLDLAGLPPDPRMEGESLRPYLENPNADLKLAFYGETAYPFYERIVPGEQPLTPELPMDRMTRIDETFGCQFVLKNRYERLILQTKERVLRTTRWKLVFTPGKRYDILRLYDLTNDPHCETDVKPRYPEIFNAMRKALWEWMQNGTERRIDEIFPDGEPFSRPSA